VILLLDNYDSFVQNLARYLRRLGHSTEVVRSDAIAVDAIAERNYQAIVLSPGPCTPNEAGCCVEVVQKLGDKLPILGVCLGHQVIAAALGGKVIRAPWPMHGRSSQVFHNGTDVFRGLPSPMRVGRYHSLLVEDSSLPDSLSVTAKTEDGLIMGLCHREWPLVGVQFHPESILTEHGYALLNNFCEMAGLPRASLAALQSELAEESSPAKPLPTGPVTF